ncbi:MAG: hypothetical protein QXU18_06880 [Thermoplasmatales archaeon]
MNSAISLKAIVLLISALMIAGMFLTISPASSASGPVASAGSPYNIDLMSNATLKNNLVAENLTINPGVTLTTDGFSIILGGSFINYGRVVAGYNYHNYVNYPSNAPNFPDSAGGSGGGSSNSYPYNGNYSAGSTSASAGLNNLSGNGFNGSSPPYLYDHSNALNNSLIMKWYTSGIQNYITGADGASGFGYYGSPNIGGVGSYGIYIQADKIMAGDIEASGQSVSGSGTYFTPGAGGGGVILLSYGDGGLVNGTYKVSGGVSYPDNYNYGYRGGDGGNGRVVTYAYGSSPPVPVTLPYLSDGMYATYTVSYQELSSSSTIFSVSGTLKYTIENISLINNTLSMNEYYSIPGDTVFSGTSTSSTNFSLSQSGFYGSQFMVLNSSILSSLDNRALPLQLSNDLGFLTSSSGIPLAGVVAVNTSVSVPSGNYYADEISGPGSSGNQTYWISSSSGMLLKYQTTQSISNGYKIVGTQSLASTNIPSRTVSPPVPPYYLYAIIGVVVVAALLGTYFANKKGYIDVKKSLKGLSKSEREKNIKRAQVEKMRQQKLISEDEYNDMMEKLK